MAGVRRSGHSRLKAALVLRDALLTELGLTQRFAMSQLRTVEDNLGAEPGLAEGKYLDALLSVCQGDAGHLAELDGEVRSACLQAGFSPRYAQYLALLLLAHWLAAQADDAAAFLLRLNAYLCAHKPKDEEVPPFTEADLQLAAFWMATAAGKTHVLHACLGLLAKRRAWNTILIITPSEALTRQHAEKLRSLGGWQVFAYPMDGDAAAIGRLPPDTVIVLDINKLAAEKKGEGVTVPTHVFKDGCNLVFVDEGHKGQKTEDSTWKALQADLAGIDATDLTHRGLLIEFSATFGQVAEGERAFGRYAKAVIFDYAYDRFHQDRYGKDFWHVRLQGHADASTLVQQQTLTAALLAFWHQRATFVSHETRDAATAAGLQLAAPLWVLLGLSVIGGNALRDKEQTSDVVDVLRFLHGALSQPDELKVRLDQLLASVGSQADILPSDVRVLAGALPREELVKRILAEVFSWRPGDKVVFRIIRSASGELGLGLLRGDHCDYFGVVNVGDASGLKKAMAAAGLVVDDDALSSSLFAALDDPGSRLNVLVGSRRFAEGWDNYRASSLTLLRLGQGEGSLIIQMFGRVVRFAGVNGNGKRLASPPKVIAPLQTAYIYGLKSGYLNAFLQGLTDNGGVSKVTYVDGKVRPLDPFPPLLQTIIAEAPAAHDFQVSAVGSGWLQGANPIRLSLAASVASSALAAGEVSQFSDAIGGDLTDQFRERRGLIDVDALYCHLVDFRRQLGLVLPGLHSVDNRPGHQNADFRLRRSEGLVARHRQRLGRLQGGVHAVHAACA